MAGFTWGAGGQAISTPEAAARQRKIAEALIAQSATPADNWATGLGDVAAALSGTVLQNRVDEAELAGRERAGGLFADLAVNSDPNSIIAALTSPDSAWASPAQTSIASALLNSGLERQDPMYQAQLQKLEQEIAMGGQPANPFLNVGNGSVFNQSTGEFMTAPQGSGALPADVQEYNFYADQVRAAGQEPLPYLDYLQAQKGNGLSITTPDGTIIQQGGGKPLTEGQSKDTVYSTRAAGALPIIDEFGEALMNPAMRAVENDPTGLARGMQSPEFQQAQQAGKEFLQAILRKDTGAAITPQETAEYGAVYLPIPGDTPVVLEQKRVSRKRALEAINAGLPPQAILAQEIALQNSGVPAAVEDTGWQDLGNGIRIRPIGQ